ncbi:MAG: caspase family protein [Bacteroidales bacterium]|nr:caspase family protein [Bacteroidales bacterium]
MKKNLFMVLAFVVGCTLSSCKTYKAWMSQPSNEPITQKLPKMEFEWYSGGDVQGANVDFVKNIIRNEINHNIVSSEGQKQGTIEVNCEKIYLKQNLALAGLSGGTLFILNLFGMPFTTTKIEMDLSFNILNANGDVIDTYKYSTQKKSAIGLYYGKDASVCMVEATKEITKKFRDEVNAKSETLIAKLENGNDAAPMYYAHGKAISPMKKKAVTKSDVDSNIPQAKKSAENTYALIIANEDYQFVDPVNFASHDGEVFKEYCIKTLGIPEKQIRYCSNASYGVISGGVDWLKYALDNFEGSKAIVYYCGHGIPDEKTGDAYIVPVDGKGTNTATCYSLNKLYTTLAATKAVNVTYFMDACFTGANKEGSMLVAARGVAREAKKEKLDGNAVVFSASSADETAMTYPEKGHGLFTYFLLKKLQETSGDVTYDELAGYINKNVKKEAFLINEKPQTPVVATSPKAASSWKSMKLK